MKRIAILIILAACSHKEPPPPAAAPSAAPAAVAPTPPAAPAPAGAHGKVATVKFHSAALGVDKDYLVYLPASYDTKPAARFPVFYYLHGLTGNETNWVHAAHLDEAADKLGLEAIVVMPDGDDAFYVDGVAPVDYDKCIKEGAGLYLQQDRSKTCVHARAYETYITKDLVAEVDAKYRTIARKDGRAIAGLSMGGFGALELAMRHTDEFAAAASHSGLVALLYVGPHPYAAGKVELLKDPKTFAKAAPFPGFNEWMRALFGDDIANWKAHDPAALVEKLQPGALALYLDCGTEDDFALHDGAQYLHDLLTAKKIDHAWFLGPGRHDFAFWIPRLPESLKFLAAHTAHPA